MTEQAQDVNQPQETSQPQGKRDLRQEITDRFVAALEQNHIPWEKPWQSMQAGLPKNMASGREYSGGNRLMLMMVQMEKGYADSRFGTIKQINDLGGRVSKGEKGHPVELWKKEPFWERKDVTVLKGGRPVRVFDQRGSAVDIGNIGARSPDMIARPSDLTVLHKGERLDWSAAHMQLDRVTVKNYVVFNAGQCNDLKLEPTQTADHRIPAIERGEQLMQAMSQDGVAFRQHAEAFYSPAKDEIYLPDRGAFRSQEGYYGTALHEIGHATGAAQRLNRDGITGGHRFGSEDYAKEELRAELFSTFMAAQTGIPHDEEQHRAYVQSWAKALKDDKNELFRAAAEAGKAVDYVLEKELALLQEHSAEAQQGQGAEVRAGQDMPAGQQAEPVQEPGKMQSVFVRKVDGVEELNDLLADGSGKHWVKSPVKVVAEQKLATADYDRFTEDFFVRQPWLDGKGGTLDDGTQLVVAVTAEKRQTLHIDPQGYDYARYVGIPEADFPRVLASRSLVENAHHELASLDEVQPEPAKDSGSTGQDKAGRAVTMHEALATDGWQHKPTGSYEKTFILSKDDRKGGEFTYGKTEAEKILNVKTSAAGFVVAQGWNDIPVPVPPGTGYVDAVRALDQAARDLLMKEHAHLGITAVRGQNEPASYSSDLHAVKPDTAVTETNIPAIPEQAEALPEPEPNLASDSEPEREAQPKAEPKRSRSRNSAGVSR